MDRDEIVPVLRGDPRGAIGGESPGGHEQMDVRMVEEVARPRMEDRETPEPAPHIPGSRASVRSAAAALFVAKGADLKATESDGLTPLHFAAYRAREDYATLLLNKGADLQARNREGFTPCTPRRCLAIKVSPIS